MAAFFRYLFVFILGAAVGAGVLLYKHPSFSVAVTYQRPHSPAPVIPKEVPVVTQVTPPAPVIPKETPPTPVVETPRPSELPKLVTKGSSRFRPSASDGPALDFAALNDRPVFWPSSVLLTADTDATLVDNTRHIGEMSLPVGSVLQVSKVLGDGTLEVRAKGLKFEIDSRLTDFDTLVRRRIREVTERDRRIPAPFLRESAPSPTPVVTPVVPVAEEVRKPAPRSAPVTVDDKMDTLFGRRSAPAEKSEPK